MAGGGFVYKEGVRLYMKPAVQPTSTTYLVGSVMVRSADETIQVSATVTDTALSILLGGSQPYSNNDYCSTSDKFLEIAIDGIVWVRSADAQSWTFGAPAFTHATDGTVGTGSGSSETRVGTYICDYTGKVADRTTTAAGELVGIKLDIYSEAT